MKDKKHVVIVTTWFPPMQSVAVNRMVAFAKYLNKDKFRVTIVSVNNGTTTDKSKLYDCNVVRCSKKQLINLPEFRSTDSKSLHKFKVILKLMLLFLNHDSLRNWKKEVFKQLNFIHREEKIDVIISSFSPAAPHEVVSDFLENESEIKWIADMRDEMSSNNSLKGKKQKEFIKLEKKIDLRASGVTTVSYPIVEYLRDVFPSIKRIVEVRNGFDHSLKINKTIKNDVFVMTYAGSFYGTRKPDTFFKALLNCENYLPQQWKIVFVGTAKNFSVPKIFEKNVEFIPKVSQEESIFYMSKSDVNLIIQPNEARKGIFTGKIFDYASVEKPILAVIDTQDVAAKLIKDLRIGEVAEFDDIEEIGMCLRKLINSWKAEERYNFDVEGVKKLHRKHQVRKMENLIKELLNEVI